MKIVKRIILIGPPGSQCKNISDSLSSSFNWNPINTGTIITKHTKNEVNVTTKQMEEDVKEHRFCNDEAVVQLIKSEIGKSEKNHRSWILEGFPRTKYQALSLQKMGVIPDRIILLTKSRQHVEDAVRSDLILKSNMASKDKQEEWVQRKI